MAVTYSFSASTTISASQVNTNFTDLLNELSGLTTSDLAANAGIVSTQLADRFAYPFFLIHLTPTLQPQALIAGANAYTLSETVMPNANTFAGATEVWRMYVQKRTGKGVYLCSAVVYCQDLDRPTADADPAVWISKNGTVIGGSEARILAADTAYFLRNSNPFDSPIASFEHDDYISIRLGTSTVAAADTEISGLTVGLYFKSELGA